MISFKAQFVNYATVRQKTADNQYKNKTVSFVELDESSIEDRKSMVNLNNKWDNKGTYINDIVECWDEDSNDGEVIRRFAITTQEKKFSKLLTEKILGVVELSESYNRIFINFLQANPRQKYKAENREFKDIGRAIINSIKELIPKKDILLAADAPAVPFYKKLGFTIKEVANDPIMHLLR